MNLIKHIFLNEKVILTLIGINAILTFFLVFHTGEGHSNLIFLDNTLTFLFLLEMFAKITTYKYRFFKSRFNRFDFTVVVLSSIPLFFQGYLESLSLLMVLRVFRMFKFCLVYKLIPNYKRLMVNLKFALKASAGIIVGILIMICSLSVILCSIYKNIAPEYFGTPFEAIYTVFRIFSIEGWYDIPNDIAAKLTPFGAMGTKLIFSIIVLFGGMLGMSFVNGVFTDEMTSDNNDEVLKEIKELKKIIQDLKNENRNN